MTNIKAKINSTDPTLLEIDKRQYGNPISKITFDALPKIYGRKQKKKYLMKYQYQYKNISPRDQLNSNQPRDQLNSNQPTNANTNVNLHSFHVHSCCGQKDTTHVILSNKAILKKIDSDQKKTVLKRYKTEHSYEKEFSQKLSQPKNETCTKKYCICNKIHQERERNESKRSLSIKQKKKNTLVKLPDLQRLSGEGTEEMEPDDSESKHKIVNNPSYEFQQSLFKKSQISLLDLLRKTHTKNIGVSINTQTQHLDEEILPTKIKNKHHTMPFQRKPEQANQIKQKVEDNTNIFEEINGHHLQTDGERIHQNRKQIFIEKQNNAEKSEQQSEKAEQKEQKEQKEKQNLQKRPSQTVSIHIDSSFEIDRKQKNQSYSQLKNHQEKISYQNSQSEDSLSSISSASLSKYVFQNAEKKNTVFHSLRKRSDEMAKDKKKDKKAMKLNYQKKNGLFIIPEEEEYINFLKEYEPMSEKFKIKNLVRKQNFKVIKNQDSLFFGQMQNNKKQGSGLMITERLVFEGKFHEDKKIKGMERNIDGVYKGQFLNGLREGQGTFEWNNGQIFEGQWKDGTKNGYGTWKSPKGDFYEGQWQMNRQHGKGTFGHRLSTFRGYFVNFLKHGEGEEVFMNGDRYKGNYKEGKPFGFGRYEWADGGAYEGQFINGVREGHGKWEYSNGSVYEGSFRNDFKHGYGKQFYKSGEYYEGQFTDGVKTDGVLYDLNKNAIQITAH